MIIFKTNYKFHIKDELTSGIGLDSRSEELDLSLHLDLTCFFLPVSTMPSNASSNVLPKHYFKY